MDFRADNGTSYSRMIRDFMSVNMRERSCDWNTLKIHPTIVTTDNDNDPSPVKQK